jgi:antitoxin component of MazEF toxin-antitoxin module
MIKTLQKYGNSHALVIDKALMEATGIGPDTPLSVVAHGDGISIRPANVGLGAEKVDELLKQMRPRYAKMLRNLAK